MDFIKRGTKKEIDQHKQYVSGLAAEKEGRYRGQFKDEQDRVDHREKKRGIKLRFLKAFRSQFLESEVEASYADQKSKTMYQPAPLKKADRTAAERATAELKRNKKNPYVDSADTAALDVLMQKDTDFNELKLSEEAWKAVGKPFTNLHSMYERNRVIVQLETFMGDKAEDLEANKEILKTYFGEGAWELKGEERQKQTELVLGFVEEVMSYNFSVAMTNPQWLRNNMATFYRMYRRTLALSGILRECDDPRISRDKDILKTVKKRQEIAQALYDSVMKDFEERGIEYDRRGSTIKKLTKEDYEKNLKRKENAKSLKDKARKLILEERAELGIKNVTPGDLETVENLSYEDFAGMIGEKNRGQITVSKGKLKIINNGFFCSKKGEVNELNLAVKKRFMAVVMEKLGENGAVYAPELMSKLHLYDEEEKACLPLSRDLICRILTEVNTYNSKVSRALRLKEGHEASVEVKIAEKINALLGEQREDKAGKNLLRSRLRNILLSGRELGLGKTTLSTHQIENIVNGNIELLRNNIFEDLMTIDNVALNLRKGDDVAADSWLTDELLTKFATLEIRRLVESTEGSIPLAEAQIDQLVTETAFAAGNAPELVKDLNSVMINGLSVQGAGGLFEEIAAKKNAANAERIRSEEYRKTLDEFALVLDRLKELAELRMMWLTRTDTNGVFIDDAELKRIGADLDASLTDEKLARFDTLLPELSGTRFEAGLNELKQKKKEGFSFAQMSIKLAEELKSGRLVREALPLEEEKEKVRFALSAEDKAAYESFSKEEKQIADIFLGQTSASVLIREPGDDASKMIAYLRDTLHSYKVGQSFVMSLPFGGLGMRLEQQKNGVMFLKTKNSRILLPFTCNVLADRLDTDVTDHLKEYGKDEVRKILNDNYQYAYGNMIRHMNMCYSVLSQITGKKTEFFNNLSQADLSNYVQGILRNEGEERQKKIDALIRRVTELDNARYFTEKQTHEYMTDKQLVNADRPVELPGKERRIYKSEEAKWTPEEEKVKDLIADLVFTRDTWDYDAENRDIVRAKEGNWEYKRGERIIKVVKKRMDAAILIMRDRSIVDRVMERMAFPDVAVEGDEKPFKELLSEDIRQIFEDPALKDSEKDKKAAEDLGVKVYVSDKDMTERIENLLYKKKGSGGLESTEQRIELRVKQISESMQKEIADSIKDAFKKTEGAADVTNIPDPYAPRLTREQQQERLALRRKELEARLDREYHSDNGQGNFVKTVLENYFKEADLSDKRVMVASLLRSSKPKRDLSKASQEEKKAEETRTKGDNLGAYLKGAGPLLQKMLQGMSEEGMPEAMKLALADMKSNLTPISDEVIKARMDSLIMRSNHEVDRIEITRSLGAASVGQAFLCRIYGPHLPQEGREVVIKLLRPEARNRMSWEKELILKCADKADPSGAMRETYEGQLRKIEEEFDLRTEEKNARMGKIYDRGFDDVKSVGLENILPSTNNTMALEKAEGTTVDRYMKDTKAARENALKVFYQYGEGNKVLTDPVTKRPLLSVKQGRSSDITRARKELEKQLKTLVKRQKTLAHVTDKWVTEGIFGKGFYHGDLHAGNIMIDDNGATIIDYGNAIELSANQQLEITRLTAAVAVGKEADFIAAFHALLDQADEPKWREKEAQFTEEVRKVFAVGAKELSGQMISLILMRAQAIGLKVPAAINNFSQSQMRLQNTLDSMNDEIYGIRKDLEELSALEIEEPAIDMALFAQHKAKTENLEEKDVLKSYLTALGENAEQSEPVTKIRENLKDPGKREQIERELAFYFEDEKQGGKDLEDAYKAYREAQDKNASPEEIEKSLKLFIDLFVYAAVSRLSDMAEEKRTHNEEIQSFFAVMGDVTNRNLFASLKRLGPVKAKKYRSELLKRQLIDAPPVAAAEKIAGQQDQGVREAVINRIGQNMLPGFAAVREKRQQKEALKARFDTVDAQYKEAQKKNGAYIRNKREAHESDEVKQANRERTMETVWQEIYAEHIDNAALPQEFKEILRKIDEGLRLDFEKLHAEEDTVKRAELEQQLRKLLVELGNENGGEEYFLGLMNGEAEKDGKLSGLGILPSEEKGGAAFMSITKLNGLKGQNSAIQKEAKRFAAKLLLLLGEKSEIGYKARQKAYKTEYEKRETERTKNDIQAAKENEAYKEIYANRYKSLRDFTIWKEGAKKLKRTDFPTMLPEFAKPEASKAYAERLRENGWELEGEAELFECVHNAVISGRLKGDHAEDIRDLLADLQTAKIMSATERENILYTLNYAFMGAGAFAKGDDFKGKDMDDYLEADGIQFRISQLRYESQGPLSYWKLRNKKELPKAGYRLHTGKDLRNYAENTGWCRADCRAIEQMALILDKAYGVKLGSGDPKAAEEAAKDIALLEEVLDTIEAHHLPDTAFREALFKKLEPLVAKIKDKKIYGEYGDFIQEAVNLKEYSDEELRLVKDAKRNQERYVKEKAEFEQGKRKKAPRDPFAHSYTKKIRHKSFHTRKSSRDEKARKLFEESGDFRSFYQYYYATGTKPIDLYNGGNKKEKASKEELMKALAPYKLDSNVMDWLIDLFGYDHTESSETSGMMFFLMGYARQNAEKMPPDISPEELKKHQLRLLDTALMLLDLEEGKNDYIVKYCITGVGENLVDEERVQMREILVKEKERIEKDPAEREKEEKERREKEEQRWKELAAKELDGIKKKGLFPKQAVGTSIANYSAQDKKKDLVTRLYGDHSEYRLMSNGEAKKLAAQNPANKEGSEDFLRMYNAKVVWDSGNNRTQLKKYGGVAPYIRSGNANILNQYVRAKASEDPETALRTLWEAKVKGNSSLKNLKDLSYEEWKAEEEKTIAVMDKATTVNTLPQDTMLFRMVGGDFLQYALGMKETTVGKTDAGSADELVNEINKKAGTVIRDTSFMSVGFKVDQPFTRFPVMLTILADKGTKCMVTDNINESEIIFGRNTRYVLLGAHAHGGDPKHVPLSAHQESYNKDISSMASYDFKGLELVVKILNDEDPETVQKRQEEEKKQEERRRNIMTALSSKLNLAGVAIQTIKENDDTILDGDLRTEKTGKSMAGKDMKYVPIASHKLARMHLLDFLMARTDRTVYDMRYKISKGNRVTDVNRIGGEEILKDIPLEKLTREKVDDLPPYDPMLLYAIPYSSIGDLAKLDVQALAEELAPFTDEKERKGIRERLALIKTDAAKLFEYVEKLRKDSDPDKRAEGELLATNGAYRAFYYQHAFLKRSADTGADIENISYFKKELLYSREEVEQKMEDLRKKKAEELKREKGQ